MRVSLQLPLRVAARDAFTVPAHERESLPGRLGCPSGAGSPPARNDAVVLRLPDDWVVG